MSTLTKIIFLAVVLVIIGDLDGFLLCPDKDLKGECKEFDMTKTKDCQDVEGELLEKGVFSMDSRGECVLVHYSPKCSGIGLRIKPGTAAINDFTDTRYTSKILAVKSC